MRVLFSGLKEGGENWRTWSLYGKGGARGVGGNPEGGRPPVRGRRYLCLNSDPTVPCPFDRDAHVAILSVRNSLLFLPIAILAEWVSVFAVSFT